MYEKIKELMKKCGIRYDTQLERLAGIKAGTMRNIKRGHTPSPDTLLKIAEALNTTVSHIIRSEDRPDPQLDELENDQSVIEYLRFMEKILIEIGKLSPENRLRVMNTLESLSNNAKSDIIDDQ